MSLTELYVKWIDYIEHATSYARNKIIIRHQSVSSPQKPFIDIHITDIRRQGTAIKKKLDSVNSIMTTTYAMTATLEVRSFADSVTSSEAALFSIIDTFDTQLQNDVFLSKIGYRGIVKEVMSLPMSLNNQQESQSIFAVKFGFNHSVNENLSWIETIDLTYNRI